MSTVTKDWKVTCKDCGSILNYSDRSLEDAAARGESRPERCPECRRKHNDQVSRMGAGYIELAPGKPVGPDGLKQGRLGCIHHQERPHERVDAEDIVIAPETFGLTDNHVSKFIKDIDGYQVAIVTAPTGSGKSTFFPYRLLEPPAGLPRDAITRHGRILVTQPRIEASNSIPKFVAESLHGSEAGQGRDIGFTNSRHKESDHRNKLVYLTDGTLLNMIKRGELYDVGTIIIDEAHERSINIDLILAMLRRELKALPHLKLIVASATIDVDTFVNFFEPDYDVLCTEFPGKTAHPIIEHFNDTEIPSAKLVTEMPAAVADKAFEILSSMATNTPLEDYKTDEVMDGDILCFLQGKRPIETARNLLLAKIDEEENLRDQVEVLPLYAELTDKQIKKALGTRIGKKAKRWRVVISTNLAETSLTVEGIRHVVDSGLINQNVWDSQNVLGYVAPKLHSQSGLLQRRGRAGRVAPGIWHCLLTEEQFNALDFATLPEIVRAPLETVLLAARGAGINDPRELKWLAPGLPQNEYERAEVALHQMGAINEAGIPTALGREISSSRETIPYASLIALADSAGCAIEAATIVAADNCGGLKPLLNWDNSWPAETKLHADRVYDALFIDAKDDLDMFIRLWIEWEQLPKNMQEQWAERRFLNASAFRKWGCERERLLESLQPKTRTSKVRKLSLVQTERLRKVILWVFPDSLYQLNGEGDLTPFIVGRSNSALIEQRHSGAALRLDSTSMCLSTKPNYLCALKRRRGKSYETPLEPPTPFVEISFCVAFDGEFDYPTSLHGFCDYVDGKLEGWKPASVLPGDRFDVDDDGQTIFAVNRLEPKDFLAATLEEETDWDDEDNDEFVESKIIIEADEDFVLWEDSADDFCEQTLEVEDLCVTDAEHEELREIALVRPLCQGLINRVIVSEIGHDGKAICAPDDASLRLRHFEELYPIGSKAPFTISTIKRLRLGKRILAVAENNDTRVSLILDSTALGFGVRDTLLENLSDCSLELTVDAVDSDAQYIEVSCIQDTIAHVGSIINSGERTVSAQVIDASDKSLYAALIDPETGIMQLPFIVLEYGLHQLPVRPTDMRVGQILTLQQRSSNRPQRRTFYIGNLNPSDFPIGNYVLDEDRLVVEGQVSDSSLKRMLIKSTQYDAGTAIRLRHAARILALRSHMQSFRIVDVAGIRSIATSAAPVGIVKEVKKNGAVVVSCEGCDVYVRADDLSWVKDDATPAIGAQLPIFVKKAEPENGILYASLKDPSCNPYAKLNVHDVVSASVKRVNTRKGSTFAILSSTAGAELYLHRSESGFFNNDDFVQQLTVGTTVNVRVLSVDAGEEKASCSLFLTDTEICLVNGREALVADKKPHHISDAFRDHAEEGTFISVDKTVVRVRSKRLDRGEKTISTIRAALAGSLVSIKLPHMEPFTDKDFMKSIRKQYGICATITANRELIVAAPNDGAVGLLLDCLACSYKIRSITVGRYRKETMQQARDNGLKIRFDGPFANGGQPAHLDCDQASDTAMLSLLTAYGISYQDNGWVVDSRFSYELLVA